MARKPGTRASGEFVLFNVIYEDGTQRSNRKVPAGMLGGLDGDEPARAVIEQQDREISAKSGMPPLRIKRITRVQDDAKEPASAAARAKPARGAGPPPAVDAGTLASPETPPPPARRPCRAEGRARQAPSRPR